MGYAERRDHMQWCVITYDGTDDQALDRRNAARPFHRAEAAELEKNGHLICGGGIRNAEDESIGSVMMLNFDTQEEFDEWYATEPFITMGVWKKIEVLPFKITVAQSMPK